MLRTRRFNGVTPKSAWPLLTGLSAASPYSSAEIETTALSWAGEASDRIVAARPNGAMFSSYHWA
jgi:hypothetical protein